MEIEYLLRLLLAALIGGAIGIEREYRDKSAGFRTMILIGVGSALFTILSFEIAQIGDDTTRIASSIVSGIGFLGAGVILKDGIHIRGLTTAATIWLVAALGMAIGAGYEWLAVFAASVILFALVVLPPFEHWIDRLHEFRRYELACKKQADIDAALAIFEDSELSIFHAHRGKKNGNFTLSVNADGSRDAHHQTARKIVDEVSGLVELI